MAIQKAVRWSCWQWLPSVVGWGAMVLVLLCLLLRRAVGMLQARSTVDGIFSDLGLAMGSLDQLKV